MSTPLSLPIFNIITIFKSCRRTNLAKKSNFFSLTCKMRLSHSNSILQQSEINLPRSVRFWTLLLLVIPSIICSCFLLFHLLINKILRSQLINHIIIVLLILGLIIELVDIPLHLIFLQINIVYPSTPALCELWWIIDFGLYSGCTILMAWGSIQRYLLIFYDRLFSNRNKRLLFHYLPLIILLIYIITFYITATVFPPCKNTYDYTLPLCNSFPCYLNDPVLGTIDSIANNIMPVFIMSLFSFILVIRVYYQKRRLRRPNIWRKQRKMTVQLLCCCILYLIPNIPQNIFVFAHLCGLSKDNAVQAQLYFNFLCYFVTLLYPFLCLASFPELHKKINFFKQFRLVAMVTPQ